MTTESDPDPAASTVPPGTVVNQWASVTGDGNYAVQAGRDVVVVPPEVLVPVAEVTAPPGLGNPRLPAARFVGRAEHLDRLDTVLAAPGPVVVAAVHGLGGIGKTTLVAQWAATRAHGYSPVWWITADSVIAVEQGLADLAAALEPVLARTLAVEQLAERGLQWLACHDGWLVVLDNAGDPHDIDTVLARTHRSGGLVVITSRLATGWQHATAVVRVDVLAPAESLDLFTGLVTAGGPRDLDGAGELCAVLGHLPLAIEQAGAYLTQNPATTPRAYLALLAGYPAAMHQRGGVATDPERTVARIWRVTVDRIAALEPFAVELLAVLAWYAPDSIPAALTDGLADPPTVNAAVGVLAAYSMIGVDPGTGAVSVHRLVQAVTRTPDPTDPHRTPTVVARARDRAATTLAGALPSTRDDPVTWPVWRTLLPHIEALADHARPDTGTTLAAVLNDVALFLVNQGLPGRAIPMLQRALTERERVLGGDHPDTLTSRNNLAYTYESAGRLDEAIALFERALTERERVLGSDHPDTLGSRGNLAYTYESAGRLDEAIPLFEQALTDCERVLGGDHPDTLTSRGNLAGAYESAGRLGEAIPLFERTLTERERVLGSDHPDTLGSRNNLAYAYQSAGRLDEAIALFERTLTERERVLGPDHPDTLTSRGNLAGAYESAGRLSEAIPLSERTLTDYERVLGGDHPDTLGSRNNLAYAYESAGRLGEAIPLFERTLTERERVLGPDHPDTLTSRNNLAYAYQSAGRSDEAIPLFERTLTERERVLGPDHPDTLTSRNNLASAYQSAGRSDEAIPLFERTLTEREQVLGSDHPHTLTSRNNLAYTYRSAGRLDEAIALYEQALTDCERVLGGDHPDTLTSRNNLAYAYESAGRLDEAIPLFERTLTDYERVLGPDHPLTTRVRGNLAAASTAAQEGGR
ncbi:tetratricopeptide repeat protein [Nocardia sp. NEAU-G5]|uniref:Tetratricopeptide repeat protein n=1 Tax=Nocardia albiluteola TaxID=2842303 RepID=A0ABS6AS21_9NOCA|nr:tetratricopeptide repeat protein [Nocardia albiluteola]MBU3060830.1 tetratricopeptide repeat protein [Nocardia albiluteola]